jgi:hypothetical protein
MKKILMGIVWFVIIQLFLGFIGGLFFSAVPGANEQTSRETFSKVAPLILLISAVLAVLGTVTEKLPGTKNKKT